MRSRLASLTLFQKYLNCGHAQLPPSIAHVLSTCSLDWVTSRVGKPHHGCISCPAAVVPVAYAEKSDLAALFGSAKASGIPDLGTGELNDMCRVFGKDNIEGEKMFRVRHLGCACCPAMLEV